jgi:hypothetical protein
VAVTRAKEHLHIYTKESRPSKFLDEFNKHKTEQRLGVKNQEVITQKKPLNLKKSPKKQQTPIKVNRPKKPLSDLYCIMCGATITQRVNNYSIKHFDKPLCIKDQNRVRKRNLQSTSKKKSKKKTTKKKTTKRKKKGLFGF